MKLIRGLYNWKQSDRGCVATIGNFDGAHLGHQQIFQRLGEDAKMQGLPAVVISFEPLPHEYFNPASKGQRLQTLRDRVSSIASCNIDRLLLLRFNQQLANQSAEEFIQHTLVEQLAVKHLLVGDDFRFGANRSGDINLLRASAQQGLFTVADTPSVSLDATRISSTELRTQLKLCDCQQAAKLLGRPHRISGRVVHGEKVGRQLGFATANICLKDHRPLLRGVFAVRVQRIASQGAAATSYPAVANLGERPSVGGRRLLLEVHLLDQSLDLYGEQLAVDFYHHIRSEKKFASLDELKNAIAADAETARNFFAAATGQTIPPV